ncbi:MAG: spermidine/putrescine ABC transporter substrate-binding protein [Tissierellaceae bacterium]|nr:spermidine/putrescine ABC transporter substrate-binding protein [Tissierellaceae bacterium]
MKKIKSIVLFVLVAVIASMLAGCGESKPSINVFNWGDYIDEGVLKEFEKEYGVKVNYSMYATNEDLYVKLKQGGESFDVIFPSDYMIERMVREGMLAKLDKDNIPNLKNIDKSFFGLDYDPDDEYSVPYMWGTVGIIYNKTMVDDVVDSWDILWEEKYKDQIIMLNSQRDTIAVALLKLGYSMNTRNIDELEEAKAELIKQRPLVWAYQGDEVKDTMVGGEAAFAVVWSGDAVAMIRDNPDLEYVIPKEGTNLWFDDMVIPANAKNKEDAEKFIDFMCRPDIAAKNADYIGYSTPIPEAIDLLPEDMKNSKVAYPSEKEIENTEIFRDPMDIVVEYDRIWTEVLSGE